MRKAFSIVFILIICCQFSKEAFFLSWYHLNQASFTEQFCVNIDLPELDCHGQCKMETVLDNFTKPTPSTDRIQTPKSLPDFKVLNNAYLWSGFLFENYIVSQPKHLERISLFFHLKKVFRPPILSS